LIAEKSPYLRQHAHNPVDWYPWGEEALAKARREDRPIFLSIGYSTCHWCHVMERESFMHPDTARLLNEHFVPIKVDREERPDLDHLYMTAVQAMTGTGGWPLTVFLTPQLEPFFGGTYFPRINRWGRPGLDTLLAHIDEQWTSRRGQLNEIAASVTEMLRRHGSRVAETAQSSVDAELGLTSQTLDDAFHTLRRTFDERWGGFGSAPKFPAPHQLRFLLRYGRRAQEPQAFEMVQRTLEAMAAGGIHDHLEGGFHRYSTDERWLVPHFEKMLYDQAGLALAYLEAWLVTHDETLRFVTEDILSYVRTRLTDPQGGFCSAEDADSEGAEGTFYVWTSDEIDLHLGRELGERFRRSFDVTPEGNWEGHNVLHRIALRPPLDADLIAACRRLREIRARRTRPQRDEKIIVAWNGYMISAFARAGRAFAEPAYLAAAASAASFIEAHLWSAGRLLRHYHDGAATVPAYLEDYAYLGQGLLDLFEATFAANHLEAAVRIAGELRRLFERPGGGFAFTGTDAEPLPAPILDIHDGALPSGNSVAALFLQRLGHLLGDTSLEACGRAAITAFREDLAGSPTSHLALAAALDFALGPVSEITIAAPAGDAMPAAAPAPAGDASVPARAAAADLLRVVAERYLPNVVLALHAGEGAGLESLIPRLASQPAIEGQATAYVCRQYACLLPVTDAQSLAAQLEGH